MNFLSALSIISLLFCTPVYAQELNKDWPFELRLELDQEMDLPALQSFSFGKYKGYWVFIGGRTDGLHKRQPWAAFQASGQNRFIYVVDPSSKKIWKESCSFLPGKISAQLESTNMAFYQKENQLYLAGGYGWNDKKEDMISFPNLTIIDLSKLVPSILLSKPDSTSCVQLTDDRLAVAGGRMGAFADTIFIAGGHRFDGMYNPMGPDHGPGFNQEYTNEIRRFTLINSENNPGIQFHPFSRDTQHLHRRDYNLVPQIFQGLKKGYTIYSGVFQVGQDLPYLNPVDVYQNDYQVQNSFEQKLNHYHTATLPIFEEATQVMHTVFFGGIASTYPNKNGKLITDNDVPFTKTISLITRKNNNIKETWLPINMPDYLGAGAEFIFADQTQLFTEGIAASENITASEQLIGYIFGGIKSKEQNIFWSNASNESSAHKVMIKVYIKRKSL